MMKYTVQLCVLLVPIVCAIKQSLYDAPPTILQPQNLDNPEKLVIIGTQTERVNFIICTARNADHVSWSFTLEADGQDEGLPRDMQQQEVQQDEDTLDISRTITDKFGDQRNRRRFNGYYKCKATNRHGFIVETPPIRFILPDMRYHNKSVLTPSVGMGAEYGSYHMKCLDEQIVYRPSDLLSWNLVTYNWAIRIGNILDPISETSRIKINPKTGDLFFSYLKSSDGYGTGDTDPYYQCEAVVNDDPTTLLVSRHKLRVMAGGKPIETFMAYPSTPYQQTVTCTERRDCLLTCIYGGRDWTMNMDPPAPKWRQPGDDESTVVDISGEITAKFKANPDAEGIWECGEEDWDVAKITVQVLMYPNIMEHEMVDQFVTTGTDVEFYCDAVHATKIRFYVNGQPIIDASHPFVDYVRGSKMIRIPNAQREHSSAVTCISFNEAGIAYKTAELNVYTKANMTIMPENGIYLKIDKDQKNMTDEITNLYFECDAYLDEKVLAADIHWRSNHSQAIEQKLFDGKHGIGVKVSTTFYVDQTITSRINFYLDLDTQYTLVGAVWWCVVEMTFAERKEPVTAETSAIPFGIAQGTTIPVVSTAGFTEWWLVGVIVAVFFFVLIIILIVCCVRQQKGEEYYVDEKERKAGHNPEEEMGLYGFSDYKRPDQDPIKGSRTSLDMSDKPLDSDSEGMDEYGDIDPGRFNEDGSFIGQYGKASSPMYT